MDTIFPTIQSNSESENESDLDPSNPKKYQKLKDKIYSDLDNLSLDSDNKLEEINKKHLTKIAKKSRSFKKTKRKNILK